MRCRAAINAREAPSVEPITMVGSAQRPNVKPPATDITALGRMIKPLVTARTPRARRPTGPKSLAHSTASSIRPPSCPRLTLLPHPNCSRYPAVEIRLGLAAFLGGNAPNASGRSVSLLALRCRAVLWPNRICPRGSTPLCRSVRVRCLRTVLDEPLQSLRQRFPMRQDLRGETDLNVESVHAERGDAGGLHLGCDCGFEAARREGAPIGGGEQQVFACIRRAGAEITPNQAADARRRLGREKA